MLIFFYVPFKDLIQSSEGGFVMDLGSIVLTIEVDEEEFSMVKSYLLKVRKCDYFSLQDRKLKVTFSTVERMRLRDGGSPLVVRKSHIQKISGKSNTALWSLVEALIDNAITDQLDLECMHFENCREAFCKKYETEEDYVIICSGCHFAWKDDSRKVTSESQKSNYAMMIEAIKCGCD